MPASPPVLSTTARISQAINSLAAQKRTFALLFGLAGLAGTLKIEPTVATYVTNNLPGVALAIAGVDISKAVMESYYVPKDKAGNRMANAGLHISSLVTVLTSLYQGVCAYNQIHQLFTPVIISGSLSATSLYLGLTVKTGWDFVNAVIEWKRLSNKIEADKKAGKENKIDPVILYEYSQAKKKVWLNGFFFLGFLTLTLLQTALVTLTSPFWLSLLAYSSFIVVGLIALAYCCKYDAGSRLQAVQERDVSHAEEKKSSPIADSAGALDRNSVFSRARAATSAVGNAIGKFASDPTYGAMPTEECPLLAIPPTRGRR